MTLILAMFAFTLTGCSKGGGEVTAEPAKLAEEIAASAVTSDKLSAISTDILASTYFVDMEQIEEGAAYLNSGASACEVTVIKCKDSAYTAEVEKLFKTRVENQSTLYASYAAGEVTKLDNAIIKSSGNYTVLCVVDDLDKANEILEEAGF